MCCGRGMNKVCTVEGFKELLNGEGGESSWLGESTSSLGWLPMCRIELWKRGSVTWAQWEMLWTPLGHHAPPSLPAGGVWYSHSKSQSSPISYKWICRLSDFIDPFSPDLSSMNCSPSVVPGLTPYAVSGFHSEFCADLFCGASACLLFPRLGPVGPMSNIMELEGRKGGIF